MNYWKMAIHCRITKRKNKPSELPDYFRNGKTLGGFTVWRSSIVRKKVERFDSY
jgi:hypothetical protein